MKPTQLSHIAVLLRRAEGSIKSAQSVAQSFEDWVFDMEQKLDYMSNQLEEELFKPSVVKEIQRWQNETFGKPRGFDGMWSAVKHLREELHDEILPHLDDNDEQTTHYLAEELADLIFLAIQGLHHLDRNAEYALKDKLEKNKARKWQEPDEDGIVRHVKGE